MSIFAKGHQKKGIFFSVVTGDTDHGWTTEYFNHAVVGEGTQPRL